MVQDIAIVLGTLAETGLAGTTVPASSIYLAFGMDMSRFEACMDVMERAGLVRRTSCTVCATEKGYALGVEINAELGMSGK